VRHARDGQIYKQLRQNGIAFHRSKDTAIFEKDEMPTRTGGTVHVRQRWTQNLKMKVRASIAV